MQAPSCAADGDAFVKASTRVVVNTVATYGRSVVGVGLAIFSSRWILQALGASDFGLFQVVGSLIVFLTFLNGVMAASATRHLAFAVGGGDANDVNRWFNTSLSIHWILPAGLIAVGWPIMEHVIRHVLAIPADRVGVCLTVFRLSLISAFISMASIPFVAMFTARQRIAELSMWDLLQAALAFVLAWILTIAAMDRLLLYAAGIVTIQVIICAVKTARALALFPECRIRVREGFDIAKLKELTHFAAWNLFGSTSWTLRNYGSAILLNVYFGPTSNAAFGIARLLSQQTNQLSTAMMTALVPELTSREGRGERAGMLSLSHFSSKAGYLLVMLFALPLVLEMDYVLQLWLREPPPGAAGLCRLLLVAILIDRLTGGYMLGIQARGRIAGYQATVGGALLLSLPLAWGFFRIGFSENGLALAFILTTVLATLGRVFWMHRLFAEPPRIWLLRVLTPCMAVSVAAGGAGMLPVLLLPASWIRVIATTAASLLAAGSVLWLAALTANEKVFVRRAVDAVWQKSKLGYPFRRMASPRP
jgi:O-antigen/teichoic acid export membrane protein